MLRTSVHNYSIADFLELRVGNRLKINRDFQRNSVWKTPGKVYLIDSILRGYPIPKLYFRTFIDPASKVSTREVVDGQQRLLAIFEFADDKLQLTARSKEYEGLRYSDLDDELKTQFLSYTFVAEQLTNANDEEILEVFSRLNSYTVALNPAELRHAQYQGDFKWAVREVSLQLASFWESHHVFSLSQRARMADDQFVADAMLQIAQGVTGGESKSLDRAYHELDGGFPQLDRTRQILVDTINALQERIPEVLEPPLSRSPHLILLIAAAAHVLFGVRTQSQSIGLPRLDVLPARPPAPQNRQDWEAVRENLLRLGAIIDLEEPPADKALAAFWSASRSAPINLASRRIRFPMYVDAFEV
ncbi:DUF262 domain-containing protein [Curtobacterium flaccumfaciens]|uniref:DUF262 domain-containing protein n=1 Tax=Curtobacterium flaccumfaciens TaxID=2035 RepID=UPI003D9A2D1C